MITYISYFFYMLIILTLSSFVVRKSSQSVNGVKIKWSQALKIVLARTLAALAMGFLCGRVFEYLVESGQFENDNLSSPYILVPVFILCIGSAFIAFRLVFSVVTGEKFSFTDAFYAVLKELWVYFKLLSALFVFIVVVLLIADLFK